ncbi:N-acetylglucosamine-6-phosphate deacetylase [soil metagenome]
MTRLQGRIVTPSGVRAGSITFGAFIEEVGSKAGGGPYLLPGFVDTHLHGGNGGDTMDGSQGVRTLARFHLEHGTTTLYPATITNPWENILAALNGVKEVREARDPELPDLPGAHLEGPFISGKRLGAQPDFVLEPTPERVEAVLALGVVSLVTLAPELPGALQAARQFAAAGVRVSVGHTVADYETVRAFTKAVRDAGGAAGFTHLYNAMSPLQSRAPGAVGAALADADSYAELIYDTHHVSEGSFLAALAAKPNRLHLVTDSIRACGLEEGTTELGGQTVTVSGGVGRLPDGTLAGSVLTLDQALRNALEAGLSLEQASRLLSQTPARYMGLMDRGTLEVGKRADIVVLDEDLQVFEVYVAGRKVV